MDSETAEEIRRHFNVVGESLRTEIRAVAEGLVGLRVATSRATSGEPGSTSRSQT